MSRGGLSLVHSVGYGGAPLHYAGGSSVLYASGNVLKRLTWQNGATSSTSFLASGLGVGTITMHPEHSHFVVSERGNGAKVSLFNHSSDGDFSLSSVFEGAGEIEVDCMRFSADGQSLVTISSLPDFKVSVWDWAYDQRTPIASGTAPGEVKQCGFNPENPYQLAFLGGGILYICNVVKGSSGHLELEFITVQPPSSDFMYVSMVWSADCRLFATATDGGLWNIDLQQYTVAGESIMITANAGVQCHLLAASEHLICWCSDGCVAWIGLKTLAEGHRIKMPLANDEVLVSACLVDNRGNLEHFFLGTSFGSVYFLEVKQGMPDGSFGEEEEEPSATVLKDADILCGEVQCCSHHSLKRILTSHGASISSICPANGGDAVASAALDGNVIIWDCLSGLPLAVQRFARPLTSIACHPFEPMLAVGDTAGFVHILDVTTPAKIKCRMSVRLFRDAIGALSLNDDGSLLAALSEASNKLYFISTQKNDGKTTHEVVGYMTFPLQGSFVKSVRWVASRHVVVGDALGYLLACTDIPGKTGDGLEMKAVFTAIKCTLPAPNTAARITAFCNLGDQLLVAASGGKAVKAYSAFEGWGRVITSQDLTRLPENKWSSEWTDHGKRLSALSAAAGGEVMATCSADGSVAMRSKGDSSGKVPAVRVSSLWLGGCSAVTVFRKDGRVLLVASGGADGSVNILSSDPQSLKGKGLAVAATGVSGRLVDLLNEMVEQSEEEATAEERQRMSDREMEAALNAAKKNTFRDSIRKAKAALDELLESNAAAPEIERIPREEIVVDRKMLELMRERGDARVRHTKQSIISENRNKEVHMSRIKALAWDSMHVHGAQLRGFQSDAGVYNYPIHKISDEEVAQLKTLHSHRRIEIAALSLQRKVMGSMGEEFSSVYLDNYATAEVDKALAETAAAEGTAGEGRAEMTVDEIEAAWRARQLDPLMYHRLDATTRERKTAQVMMLQQVIRKIKERFNGRFEEYLKKKGGALARIDEKMARLLEILKELKSGEVVEKAALEDAEQPDKVLNVQDSEIGVSKWVSPAEIKAREEEERRQRELAGKDDTAERALSQMMGGSLAGQSAVGKLDMVMVKPEHLVPPEGEDLSEERVKELKEWEAQYKAFIADQEAYTRTLDAEGKKLKSEIAEECQKFDLSLQDLAKIREDTDYQVYELELYKMKLTQSIAQEEEDILVQRSVKKALVVLEERRSAALEAVQDYEQQVQQAESGLKALRDEEAALERQFVKDVWNSIHTNNKELAEQAMKCYKKRADMHELLEHGISEDELDRSESHLQAARGHDAHVDEQHARIEEMRAELLRLQGASQLIAESIVAAEAELEQVEVQMVESKFDLDITLCVKQGQVEVDQAAVVTNYSDAQVVEKACIEAHNAAIIKRGTDKVAVLHEIKEFRKGIHGLEWDNLRLDLEEEDLLQRTKDLQLLRVTKSLQSVIKGSDTGKDASETQSLEKLIAYQTNVHKTRVAEKLKAVQLLQAQARGCQKENHELDEDMFALESAVVERQRLCELQGTSTQASPVAQTQTSKTLVKGLPVRNPKEVAKMNMMVTHRKLLDLAKAQTREIELMREELVRLRARTFPSFAQVADHSRTQDVRY